ncbi:MAG: DUF58 domain-containing protein [Gammaproteobacteria bacterium]|nr:DUF58 domain-containing protein [Gammaproteobacteria bacterium]
MKPSRHLLLLLLVWVGLGLLVSVAQIAGWQNSLAINLTFWSYGILLGIVTLFDFFMARYTPKLEVIRTLDPHLALGVRQRVTIKLSNRSANRQSLWLTDSPSSKLQLQGLPVKAQIAPGEHFVVRYTITPLQRGLAQFGQVCCRIMSPLKLWERNSYFCKPEQAKIYPNYKPLFQSSFINSDLLYSDWGVQISQRRGDGTDFRQLRDFRVGDSLRQIDWRASARFNRPISREYQEERDQQVIFLLDCGRRMRAKDGDISHFDHALNALVLSAFVVLRQGDSVGLLSFAGQPRWVPPFKGRLQVGHLLDQIYDLDSTLATSDYLEVAQQLMTRQSKRSLIILISSIEPEDRDDLSKAVKMLSQHHLVLVACMRQQVLTDAQHADIVSLEDALKYCGASRQMQKQASMLTDLRSQNVIVADTQPSYMHSALISEYMALKRGGAF